jgi:hypothetical protein
MDHRYEMDGPEIETRLEQHFPHLALESTVLPIQWVQGLSRR